MSLTLSYLPADAFHFTTPTDAPEFFPMPDPPRNKQMMYKVKCNDADPLATVTRTRKRDDIPEGWTADDYYNDDDARKSRELDELALAPPPAPVWPMFPFRGYDYLQATPPAPVTDVPPASPIGWADADTDDDSGDDWTEDNGYETADEHNAAGFISKHVRGYLARRRCKALAVPSIFADAHPIAFQPVDLSEPLPTPTPAPAPEPLPAMSWQQFKAEAARKFHEENPHSCASFKGGAEFFKAYEKQRDDPTARVAPVVKYEAPSIENGGLDGDGPEMADPEQFGERFALYGLKPTYVYKFDVPTYARRLGKAQAAAHVHTKKHLGKPVQVSNEGVYPGDQEIAVFLYRGVVVYLYIRVANGGKRVHGLYVDKDGDEQSVELDRKGFEVWVKESKVAAELAAQ